VSSRATLALCAFAMFLDGYDIQALGLAIPGLAKHWGVVPTSFAPAMSGSLVGMAAGAMLLAPMGDRFGRHKMMVLILFLIGLTTAGLLTATTPTQLAVWRTLSGLGMGALVPVAITIASECAAEGRRTLVVTLIVSCMALGSFAAGILAPILDFNYGWQGIFGVGAAMPLAAGTVFLAISYSQRGGIRDVKSANTGFFAALVCLLRSPLQMRTLLLWVIFFISLFATYSLISWLPSLLTSAGWERAAAQRAAGFMALGSVLGGLALAWAADRGRAVPALFTAYTIAALSFAIIALEPSSKPVWIALLMIVGAGSIGSQLALGSLASSFYPESVRATGVGWSSGMGRVGSIFGPIVLAALVSAQMGPAMIIGSLAVPMAICALCVLLLPRALRDENS